MPGGYRNTINDNLVVILMIETLEGLKNAEAIAKVPGVTAIFAASGDLANFTGYRQGDPDYERAINIVHDAALAAGVRLCGPFAWRDRPDFTCFQNASETALIARGAAAELGRAGQHPGQARGRPVRASPNQSRRSRPPASAGSRAALRACCGTPARPTAGRRRSKARISEFSSSTAQLAAEPGGAVDDDHRRAAGVGVDADQAVEPDVDAGLLARFAHRRQAHVLAAVDVAAGEDPQPEAGLDGAPDQHDAAVRHAG